jgi:hypothetical protein
MKAVTGLAWNWRKRWVMTRPTLLFLSARNSLNLSGTNRMSISHPVWLVTFGLFGFSLYFSFSAIIIHNFQGLGMAGMVLGLTGGAIGTVAQTLSTQTRRINELEKRLSNLDKATNESDPADNGPPDDSK